MCELQSLLQSHLYIHSAWLCIYQNLRQLHIYLQFHVTKPVRVADAELDKYFSHLVVSEPLLASDKVL